ncbi:MAG: hypothetical protein JWO70_2430 [Betaproteobacteria bacterium]|nr:hypothetical protein [Betaproteobacteria bacterium]
MRLSEAPDAQPPAQLAAPAPAAAAAKLRIGIVLGSEHLRAWEASMLRRIRTSDYAEIVVAVLDEQNKDQRDALALQAAPGGAGGLLRAPLHAMVEALEAGIVCERDAFAWDDAGVRSGVETIKVNSSSGALELGVTIAVRIEALDLDVWVHLGGSLPGADLQQSSRYGVWRLTHDGWSADDATAAGFWPVCLDATVIESALVADRAGSSQTLATSVSGTNRYSVKLNRSALYWKISSLLPRTLEALHRAGAAVLVKEHRRPGSTGDTRRVPTAPQLAVHVGRNIRRRAGDFLHRHFALDRWVLLVHAGDEPCTAGAEFTTIIPPKDCFWADPHVVRKGDRYYVFIEELTFASGKGHISVLVLDDEGTPQGPATKVLERDYHLSYPCVFEHAGDFFMIPESSENRTVDLYRCIDFPSGWQHVATLLKDIDAVDTTVLEHEGQWWLFVGVRENEGASYCEELFVFHAPSLTDTHWTPHAANPVVSDVRRARPAGAMFRRGGKLYRPAQDCSVRYGYAVKLNEVTLLTPTDYAEAPVADLLPDWDWRVIATHTLAYTPGLTLIDALQPRLKL